MTPPVPKLSRYRDCRSSQTSGAGHFDRPQATELECDTAAGHHGHRSGYPAGEHQPPGPQALRRGPQQPAMPTTSGSKSSSIQPIPFQPRLIPDNGSGRPSTSGRHDCAAPCRTETRAPACTPRTAPTTRRSAPGAARRTRHRRRRSRTPGPPATPTRPRGPHSPSARESSLPAGPAPRPQNPQPMSELRNHARKLTPNSAILTRTGQPAAATTTRITHHCLVQLKIARDAPRLQGFAIWSGRSQRRCSDLHCNFGVRSSRARRAAAARRAGSAQAGVYRPNCSSGRMAGACGVRGTWWRACTRYTKT